MLYRHLRLLTNFFYPQAKLVSKTRNGARVTRRYDTPTTPYRRVLAAQLLTETESKALQHFYKQLNPAQLRRDVIICQQQLRSTHTTTNQNGMKGGEAQRVRGPFYVRAPHLATRTFSDECNTEQITAVRPN